MADTCIDLEKLNTKNMIHKSEFPKFQCEECIKINSKWVNLRICQTCGKMLCCDSSPNQHARKHYEKSKHPVISSGEPGTNWLYCYEHDKYKDL